MHPIESWRSSNSSFNYWLCNVAVTSQSSVRYLSSGGLCVPDMLIQPCRVDACLHNLFIYSHTDLHPPCIRTVPAIPTFHLFLHLFARLPHLCWQWVNIFSFNGHYLESLWGQGLHMNRPLLEEMTQKVLRKKHWKAGARVISLIWFVSFKTFAFDHCTPLHPLPPALPCLPILHRTSH